MSELTVTTIWQARDRDGVRVDLDQVTGGDWQLSLEDGPFSGYPVVDLDRSALKALRDVLNDLDL